MLKHVGHHRTSSSSSVLRSSCSRLLESPSRSPSVASSHEDNSPVERIRHPVDISPSGSPPCTRIRHPRENLSSGTPSRDNSPSAPVSCSRIQLFRESPLSTPPQSRTQMCVTSSPSVSPSSTRVHLPAKHSPSRSSSPKVQCNSSPSASPSKSRTKIQIPASQLGPCDAPQGSITPSRTVSMTQSSTSSPVKVHSKDASPSYIILQSGKPSPSKTPTAEVISSKSESGSSEINGSPELTRRLDSERIECDAALLQKSCREALARVETFALYDGYEEAVERPMTLPRRAHRNSVGKASKARLLNKSYSNLHTPVKSSSSLRDQPMSPVKVYMRNMKPDIKYTTVNLSSSTTCRELIALLLAKFRLRHRDPNLFYIRMEVVVRSPGGDAPGRRLLVLDDYACPAELQQCRPRGEARFSVGVRRGGLLRVHDSILMPGSQYKSLLVSYRTTSEELVQLLLNCYNNKENPDNYTVHEVNKNPYTDRPLQPDECPLLVQSDWPKASRHNYAFVLRRNVSRNIFLRVKDKWRNSLTQSSTDTESDLEDHPATGLTTSATSDVINSFKNMLLRTSASDPIAVSSSLLSSSASFVSGSPSDSGFSSPSSSRSSTASDTPTPPSSPPRPCTPSPSHVLTLSLPQESTHSETHVGSGVQISCLEPSKQVSMSPEATFSSAHLTERVKESSNSLSDIVSISSLQGTFITIPDTRVPALLSYRPTETLTIQCPNFFT